MKTNFTNTDSGKDVTQRRQPLFEKTFSRDITFLIASAGFYDFPEAITNSPYDIFRRPVLKQVHNGVVEFWIDNEAFEHWNNEIKNTLLADLSLLERTKLEYQSIAKKIREFSLKPNPAPQDALSMYQLFVDIRFSNHVMFFSSMMEGWPDEIRSWSIEERAKDDLWSMGDAFVRKALASVGVSLEQIKAMTPAQLKDYIDHGTIPIIATEAFVEDCAGNIYKSDISTLAREYGFSLPDEVLVQQELSGQVGYRGVVIGKVGIVRTKEDLHKIDTGDILVSPMTTPDFLPAMQRAAAFVTDEGGVLCHAAIVSREMKKPCVIGTKIATKILKDGDLVEVDGNNGIVKIKKEGAA